MSGCFVHVRWQHWVCSDPPPPHGLTFLQENPPLVDGVVAGDYVHTQDSLWLGLLGVRVGWMVKRLPGTSRRVPFLSMPMSMWRKEHFEIAKDRPEALRQLLAIWTMCWRVEMLVSLDRCSIKDIEIWVKSSANSIGHY